MSERYCGTCRLYVPPKDGESGYCTFEPVGQFPFWLKWAIDHGDDEVDADDGERCDTWVARPERGKL